MSPASSASSFKPFLTRTSRVGGKVTRRSPIAVSPRMFSTVITYRSRAGSTSTGRCTICLMTTGVFFVSALFRASPVLAGLAGLPFFPPFFALRGAARCFFAITIDLGVPIPWAGPAFKDSRRGNGYRYVIGATGLSCRLNGPRNWQCLSQLFSLLNGSGSELVNDPYNYRVGILFNPSLVGEVRYSWV